MRSSVRVVLAASLLLSPCAVGAAQNSPTLAGQPAPGQPAAGQPAAGQPSDISPPAGEAELLKASARGVQIYVCSNVSGHAAWTLKAPEAKLYDASGNEIGTHFAGPTWKLSDTSAVQGKLAASRKSPDPGAIPWLLVAAAAHNGQGKLSHVDFIQRIDTQGGVAPATGCDPQHQDQEVRVPYTATYVFFGK
jgi:hypothetical protein